MKSMSIKVVKSKYKTNLINIYNSHLKDLCDDQDNSYSLVSKIPKNYHNQTCLDILAADSIIAHVHNHETENSLQLIKNFTRPGLHSLVNELPQLSIKHYDLNYDQKVIFHFLRCILKEQSVILIGPIDQFISSETLNEIKKSIFTLKDEYTFFIQSDHFEFWSDIASHYILIDKGLELINNKLIKNSSVLFEILNEEQKQAL